MVEGRGGHRPARLTVTHIYTAHGPNSGRRRLVSHSGFPAGEGFSFPYCKRRAGAHQAAQVAGPKPSSGGVKYEVPL
jgi:hypothetical protein